jgi:hypothetical protein
MYYEETTILQIDSNKESLAKEPITKEELPKEINYQYMKILLIDKV